MFIGYDDYSQWYWQQYKDGTGTYTPISGTSYPKENTSVHVRVSWTADKKVTVTVDENKIVDALECADFIYTNKIGFKCSGFGSGSSKQLTEVWLSDIHYTGQKEVATYAVSGKVTDAAGAAIAGATVELNGNKATTAADGSYTLLEVPAEHIRLKCTKMAMRRLHSLLLSRMPRWGMLSLVLRRNHL